MLPGVYLTAPASGRKLTPFVPSSSDNDSTNTGTSSSTRSDNKDNDLDDDNIDDDSAGMIADVNQLEFDIRELERSVSHLQRSNQELVEALEEDPNDQVTHAHTHTLLQPNGCDGLTTALFLLIGFQGCSQ